jgi:hypothetical protein
MSPTVQVYAAIRCVEGEVDARHNEYGDVWAGQIGGVSSFRVVRCLCIIPLEGDLPILAGNPRRCDLSSNLLPTRDESLQGLRWYSLQVRSERPKAGLRS